MPGLQILYALCFFLRAHLSQAEDSLNVTQKPLIQVAFKNDQINITCENNFRSNSNVNSFVYQDGHWEKPLSTRHNIFNEIEVQHNFKADSKSSVYYCMVAGNQKTNIGSGTYVHVRDSGYVEPSGASQYLRASLISLCILLLLSSIAGTLLLLLPLYWTKQAGLFRRAGLNFIGASTKSKAPQEGEEKTGSLYMSLQPHSEDVYDVLDSNAPDLKAEDKKAKVKIHDTIVQSPLKKPKAMIIPACYQETTKVNVEKTPLKLRPEVEIHDTIVQPPLKKPKAMIIPACFQETTKVPVNVEKTPIKLVKSDGMQEKTKEETEKKPVKLVKSAGIQEKTKGESEKPPIKLKPQREDTNHMVYENLHT